MSVITRMYPAVLLLSLALMLSVSPKRASAHCDTLDGPVVKDARAALEKGDATLVLHWVRPEDEAQIRQAFAQTLKVRALNADAMDLADSYFFETVVRVHRAGEGEPYTGLKPAGADMDPGIAAADKSLVTGKVAPMIAMVNDEIAKEITARFKHTLEMQQHMKDSVDNGRKYVEAYVQYIHYVEQLLSAASGKTAEHAAEATEKESH